MRYSQPYFLWKSGSDAMHLECREQAHNGIGCFGACSSKGMAFCRLGLGESVEAAAESFDGSIGDETVEAIVTYPKRFELVCAKKGAEAGVMEFIFYLRGSVHIILMKMSAYMLLVPTFSYK